MDRVFLSQQILLFADSDGEAARELVDEFDAVVFVRANTRRSSFRKLGIKGIESTPRGGSYNEPFQF